jgi:F0F1-type ATP synthase alpha subunit
MPKKNNQLICSTISQETHCYQNIKKLHSRECDVEHKQQQTIEYGNAIHEILSYINSKEEIPSLIQKKL